MSSKETTAAKHKQVTRKTATITNAQACFCHAQETEWVCWQVWQVDGPNHKSYERLAKAVAEALELDETVFSELDSDINSKKQIIEYLNMQYDKLNRTQCLDVDLVIKKHGIEACKKLLEDIQKIKNHICIFFFVEKSFK